MKVVMVGTWDAAVRFLVSGGELGGQQLGGRVRNKLRELLRGPFAAGVPSVMEAERLLQVHMDWEKGAVQ